MDRYWFFTWRTYGTWVPGDDGFVGYYHAPDGRRLIDHRTGDPATEAIPALARYARTIMADDPVALDHDQAIVVARQLHETAAYRGWLIDAVAVLTDHVHVVFGVPGDPDPSDMLRDLKSYASRALNRLRTTPRGTRWWADQGSKRRLGDEFNRARAIRYVRDQPDPLHVKLSAEALELVAMGEPAASAAGWPPPPRCPRPASRPGEPAP